MAGYELVRSDDAVGAPGTDLESGASASKASPPSPAPSTSPAARQQRLVSLDVFRGITVLVRPLLLRIAVVVDSRTN
jgi:heparan-alpha-glucosaminide N-acetyltransferase